MPKLRLEAATLPLSHNDLASGAVSLPTHLATIPAQNGLLNFTAYQAQRYMPALDGLRGLAVALVITRHLHKRMWEFLSGSVGVTIFFILSGYLITRLALGEERATGKLNLAAFYIRRSFRIFPMYYLVLAIYAALILGTHMMPAKAATFPTLLPYYIGYLQELPVWGLIHLPPGDLPFYQTWSLGIEEKFYLVWPVLMVVIGASRRTARLAVALVLAIACALQGLLVAGRHMYSLESYAPILFGVVLALALADPGSYQRITAWVRKLTIPAALLLFAIQFVLMPHTALPGLVSLYALTGTVLLGSLVTSKGLPVRMLSAPWLTLLGRISYGVYLLHILCLFVVERFLKPERGYGTGLLAYAVTLLLSATLAYMLHISFEKPLVRLGRKLSRREIASEPSPEATEAVLDVPVLTPEAGVAL